MPDYFLVNVKQSLRKKANEHISQNVDILLRVTCLAG